MYWKYHVRRELPKMTGCRLDKVNNTKAKLPVELKQKEKRTDVENISLEQQ